MAPSATIKAIESSTVHQIQSGQVIVDLCSVAKELVENSLDAGATAIEVRFKNQGLDSIEVQDNGSGIAPHNYESVALKHYTSKLSSFDDLSELQTFGFRGEALSSLCALSRFVVVTCTQQDVPRASRLEFETSGKLKSTSVVSGQRGTTVIVEDLFRGLPVRRRELERNIKREWGKVIGLLNQYACVQTGVRFTVSQQPTKGKRMILFSTKGNATTRENIINVFGVKTMSALIPMDLKLELIPTAGPLVKGKTRGGGGGSTTEVRVTGHVSRPNHGEGRQTPDRQMFYVNGRPCGLPQFAKVFNEVYRLYNASQSPFIFADIQLDTHLYDVNVSPDKRTILLHDQGQMLDNLRESLIELFETQDVTIPVSQSQPGLKQASLKTASGRSWTPAPTQAGKKDASVEPRRSAESTSPESSGRRVEGGGDEEELDDAGEESRAGEQASPKSAGSQTAMLLSRWLAKGADGDDREPVDQAKRGQGQADVVPNNHTNRKSTILSGDDSSRDSAAQEQTPEVAREDGSPKHQAQSQPAAARRSPPSADVTSPERARSRGPSAEPEPPVAAIAPPSQPTAAPRAVAVSAARPFKRSSQEVATITIGDHTVTSLIGNPAKRTKVAEARKLPKVTAAGKTGKGSAPLPTFGGRLSRLFSASARPGDGPVERVESPAQDSDEDMQESEGEIQGEEEDDDEGGEEEEEDTLFVPQSEVAQSEREDVEDVEDEEADASCPGKAEDTDSLNDDANVSTESVGDSAPCHDDASADDHHGHFDEKDHEASDGKRQQVTEPATDAAESTGESAMRSQLFVKGRSKRKDMTLNLVQHVKTSPGAIQKKMAALARHVPPAQQRASPAESPDGLEAEDAEEKLSLKITKSDFGRMRIVGQFNLGFILAVREAASLGADRSEGGADDELFIIDQHASDEKYNFERLQATTTVQSQRLVQPKTLDLTALEEEIVLEHLHDLERNGFQARVDTSGARPVGSRVQLLSLPLSRETTFSLADLEELLVLLADNPTSSASTVPRPSKVRKMFAMRACRSSIMIGRALSRRQMETVVRHMGEMEKPWNCPHGRPTMRHLCGLGGTWDGRAWVEEGEKGRTDWAGWAREKKREKQDEEE
ncbi:hypothetical protein VTH06DRAFT_6056 [Thermothelomyces fergusii]